MNRPVQTLMVGLLLFVPSMVAVQAQDDSAYVLMGTDPEGDIDGETTENPWNPMDVVSLEMQEDGEGFHFRLGVRGLTVDAPETNSATDEELADQFARRVYYRTYFTVNEVEYVAYVSYVDDPESVYGYLGKEDPEFGFISYLKDMTIDIDEDLPGFTFSIEHNDLTDANGVQPRPGDELHDIYVFASSTGPQFVGAYTSQAAMKGYDYLPDDGVLDATWEVQHGVVSVGHIFAWSDLPVRVSNGEATTFLYEVDVTNEEEYADTVIPGWSGGTDNWAVTFPSGKIRLDPGETRTVPFLVTVPFAHEHGQYYPFIVEFQSQADPLAKGIVELGVRYTTIPQPAGHHPEVYMHGSGSFAYFNTIKGEEYPEDAEETGSNSGSSCGGGDYRAYLYPLSPSLEMGLDFDLDRQGEANIILHSEYPSSGYSFGAYFVVDDERPSPCVSGGAPDGTVAIVERTEPVETGMDETVTITSPIQATAHGDYVTYTPGMQLWMIFVRYTPDSAGVPVSIGTVDDVGVPEWQPDSSFLLPLEEYHDDVDDFFDQFTGIDLFATTEQQRMVNPGEVTVFQIEATNIDVAKTTVDLSVTGANTEWATILGSSTIKLAPGETREIAIAVRPATGAVDGELADITMHAVNADDESVRSLIRLLAEVDTDEDHPDESETVPLLDEELQQAPAPLFPALIALAVVGAFMRRRR